MTKDTEALLPCPFCGAREDWLVQIFKRCADDLSIWSVECLDCGAKIESDVSQSKADDHWNTRAAIATPATTELGFDPTAEVGDEVFPHDTIGSHFGNGGGLDPAAGDVMIGNFIAQYDEGAAGCLMDADDAQSLAREFKRMQGLIYCPGVLRCAKCDFRLIKTTLTPAGAFANEEPDSCPNCNVPMWRVTWQDEARDAYKTAESQMNRALEAERAHPPHPTPVDPVAGGEALREALAYNSDGLLPCPKCEGRNAYTYFWQRGQAWIVICSDCKHEADAREAQEHQARRIWNDEAEAALKGPAA